MISYIKFQFQFFLVEINLDVVLEVLLVVDLNFFLIKLVDKYKKKIQ